MKLRKKKAGEKPDITEQSECSQIWEWYVNSWKCMIWFLEICPKAGLSARHSSVEPMHREESCLAYLGGSRAGASSALDCSLVMLNVEAVLTCMGPFWVQVFPDIKKIKTRDEVKHTADMHPVTTNKYI